MATAVPSIVELNKMRDRKFFPIVFWVVVGLLLALRIYPALTLPPNGDEGADLITLYRDYLAFPKFFDADISISADQSRLSYLVAAPLISLLGGADFNIFEDIGMVRLLFLLLHTVYLIVSYRFIADMLKNRAAAYAYVGLLVSSCYLASYSIATMTTGESVYMLFQVGAIWVFFDNFQGSLSNGADFRRFGLLCFLLALCIASKLFGLTLIAAFFVFHLIHRKHAGNISITTLAPKYLLFFSIAFFVGIIVINLISIPLFYKSVSALGLGIGYVLLWGVLLWRERSGGFGPYRINMVCFWALLTFCTFTLVLVFSPIYLNLENFFDVFNWFSTWGPEKIKVQSHKIDGLIILMTKFGFVPTFLLLLVSGVGIIRMLKKPGQQMQAIVKSIYFLLFLIVFVNLLLISCIHLKLPWHGISIFPFLFLPFIALFSATMARKSRLSQIIMLIVLAVVSVDNLYRYADLYPYGHLDGCQYGKNFIGLNKPCLISFEAVPKFYDYVAWLKKKENRSYRAINVHGTNVKIVNDYLIQMLKYYFSYKGDKEVEFESEGLLKDKYDLIISNPISTPEFDALLNVRDYRKLKTISIAGITVANIWQGKDFR